MLCLHFSCDVIYVYDGYDRLAKEINVLTGSTKPSALVSTGPAISISFATDTSIPKLGFEIKYQMGGCELYYTVNCVLNKLNI